MLKTMCIGYYLYYRKNQLLSLSLLLSLEKSLSVISGVKTIPCNVNKHTSNFNYEKSTFKDTLFILWGLNPPLISSLQSIMLFRKLNSNMNSCPTRLNLINQIKFRKASSLIHLPFFVIRQDTLKINAWGFLLMRLNALS